MESSVNIEGVTPALSKKPSRISHYSKDTGIDISYAEKTWKPAQSVVDIIQNHLDAQTARYEKQMLATVGITEYKPEDHNQQQLVAQLDAVKYAADDNNLLIAGKTLQLSQTGRVIDTKIVKEQVDKISYDIPPVYVKVTDGIEQKLVSYEEMLALPQEWQVAGFRVYDQGAGYDNELLGMIGASTKGKSTSARGGIGEGLKMSALRIEKLGGKVNLLSRNQDALWTGHSEVQEGKLHFTGVKKQEGNPPLQGSITDVDLIGIADVEQKEAIINAIDPRKGEGLGKYILEYRDTQFVNVINKNADLTQDGIAPGRVYVKGLLIKEEEDGGRKPLLGSYNFADKWAIGGRDRKNIPDHVLIEQVGHIIGNLKDSRQMAYILSKINAKEKFIEHSCLDWSLKLNEEQQTSWKQAIETTFNFIPGKTLFTTSITIERENMLREQGYTVIRIPNSYSNLLGFFQKVYGGEKVTVDQLGIIRNGKNTESAEPREKQDIGEAVSDETRELLDTYKNDLFGILTRVLGRSILSERTTSLPRSDKLTKLAELKYRIIPEGEALPEDTFLRYDRENNILFVTPQPLQPDYLTRVDTFVEFLKPLTASEGFTLQTQEILNELLVDALVSMRDDGFNGVAFPRFKEVQLPERFCAYVPEEKTEDQKLIDYFANIRRVSALGVKREEVEEALNQMRVASPSKREIKRRPSPLTKSLAALSALRQISESSNSPKAVAVSAALEDNTPSLPKIIYLDGEIYTIDPNTLTLQYGPPEGIGKKRTLPSVRKFFTNPFSLMRQKGNESSGDEKTVRWSRETSVRLPSEYKIVGTGGDDPIRLDTSTYVPYDLGDGEELIVLLKKGNVEDTLVIKRAGGKISTQRYGSDGKVDQIEINKPHNTVDFSGTFDIYNNVIHFGKTEGTVVTFSRQKKEVQEVVAEVNRGSDYLPANITVDYGGDVWQDPKRILIDAIQNHIDAQKALPEMVFSVVNGSGEVRSVSKDVLAGMDRMWSIIGVNIKDRGKGYTTPYLRTLGKTTKDEGDAGKFGEGLKMLSAAAVRQGIDIELGSRDWVAKPTSASQTITDYTTGQTKEFAMLGYDMAWTSGEQIGSYTKFGILSSLKEDQTRLTPAQEEEFIAKFRIGKNNTVWLEWTEVVDPRITENGKRGLERYVLSPDEINTESVVSILPERPGEIFEKGLNIPGGRHQPFLFGYNIAESIINTRERNNFSEQVLNKYLVDYYANLTDPEVMRKILQAAKDTPREVYREYAILADKKYKPTEQSLALWKKTYYEMFGDTAILSSRDEEARVLELVPNFPVRIYSPFDTQGNYKDELSRAVANEIHLESGHLVRLPQHLSGLLYPHVYTSLDFVNALEGEAVPINDEERDTLFTFAQHTNERMVTILESIDSNGQRRGVLEKVGVLDDIEERKQKLRQMKREDVRVMYPDYPAMGIIEEDDDSLRISLNQAILTNRYDLLKTYGHEVVHFLSKQGDYTRDFHRMFMLLAINGHTKYLN